MKLKSLKGLAFGIGGIATGAIVATGVAVAGTPAADGTYTACVGDGGATRIIDAEAGDACAEGEQTISWTSGWRNAGTYSKANTYQVGDVVRRSNDCAYEASAPRMRGIETWVKIAPGPERTEYYTSRCPYSGDGWLQLSRMPEIPPDSSIKDAYRVPATASATQVSPRDGNGFELLTWNYGGVVWIQLPSWINANQCSVSAMAVSFQGITVTRADGTWKDFVGLYIRQGQSEAARTPIDVTLSCPGSL